jgi:hypothetical protein
MTALSRLIGRFAKLPPAEMHNVMVERDLQVPMPDGVVLLADRYVPYNAGKLPTLLVRSCYGRRGFFGLIYGYLFAEQRSVTSVCSGWRSRLNQFRYWPRMPGPYLSREFMRVAFQIVARKVLADALNITREQREHV